MESTWEDARPWRRALRVYGTAIAVIMGAAASATWLYDKWAKADNIPPSGRFALGTLLFLGVVVALSVLALLVLHLKREITASRDAKGAEKKSRPSEEFAVEQARNYQRLVTDIHEREKGALERQLQEAHERLEAATNEKSMMVPFSEYMTFVNAASKLAEQREKLEVTLSEIDKALWAKRLVSPIRAAMIGMTAEELYKDPEDRLADAQIILLRHKEDRLKTYEKKDERLLEDVIQEKTEKARYRPVIPAVGKLARPRLPPSPEPKSEPSSGSICLVKNFTK